MEENKLMSEVCIVNASPFLPAIAPHPQLTVRHYFVDEAGDPIIYDRKGKVIIGENGCSK